MWMTIYIALLCGQERKRHIHTSVGCGPIDMDFGSEMKLSFMQSRSRQVQFVYENNYEVCKTGS